MKDPPQGITPPTQSQTPRKATHQPNRLRKFVASNSAGLRVRSHPSLQSEQIGVVHVNGTIAFIDEVPHYHFLPSSNHYKIITEINNAVYFKLTKLNFD